MYNFGILRVIYTVKLIIIEKVNKTEDSIVNSNIIVKNQPICKFTKLFTLFIENIIITVNPRLEAPFSILLTKPCWLGG